MHAICRRLDGLPLAVELAAARTKLLTPERLLERLDHALPLLTGGARDAPERQRTLRTTIAWSYDLLDEECGRLFARLSVFAGGFPLEAAEAACDAELETLATLVDVSLLKAIGDNRFLLLETIREFAAEHLPAEASEECCRRHAGFFAALAENAYTKRFEREVEWASRLERDHDDLRAALDWLTATGDEGAVLRLCGALGWFWLSHAHLVEGARRIETALGSAASDARAERGLSPLRVSSWGGSGRPNAAARAFTRPSPRGRDSLTTPSSRMRWMSSAGSSSMSPTTNRQRSQPSRRALLSSVASVTAAGRPARSSASAKSW